MARSGHIVRIALSVTPATHFIFLSYMRVHLNFDLKAKLSPSRAAAEIPARAASVTFDPRLEVAPELEHIYFVQTASHDCREPGLSFECA